MFLIVNSSASSVTARNRASVEAALGAEHQLTVAETTCRDHATSLAREAASDGQDVVVVFGGDGTLNEAANGLAAGGSAGIALAPLPGGSTNVFARTIGYGNNPVKAAAKLLAALRRPGNSLQRVGLGQVNGRYYLFNAGLGFDAAVVEMVEQHAALKRRLGHPLYVYATVSTFTRHYDRKHPHFDLVVSGGPDGPREIKDVYFAICLKSNPYTYLGRIPLNVAPEAGLNTGITVVAFQKLGLTTILGVNMAAMTGRGGPRLAKRRHIAYQSNVSSIQARAHGTFKCQMDGEFLGDQATADVSFHPNVLSLVVPPA
ncbi:MAG TPA: diacylglycerol kinase family protein [Acidimicrobiales bacterium]|jgi:diacylglycerol kinase family enzyme|nr:diacylglycerol kinase family protein [Acidimicrobiales bacterium]